MRVELLVALGCPAREATEKVLGKILQELAPGSTIETTVIDTAEEAVALKFPGSPSVRINGRDIEPEADKSLNYGLG